SKAYIGKVALVTGGNKGIGFAIVRAMCKDFAGDVYLTARDVGRGTAAVDSLKKEGLAPLFHQLDINDPDSVRSARDFFTEKYGGLDVLVNNAAESFLFQPSPQKNKLGFVSQSHYRIKIQIKHSFKLTFKYYTTKLQCISIETD
uniref:Carbonyl reductase 1 n=1 Tax=Cyprinus carpio TaxID=7962 RepID=A0A8C1LNP6_CYPCA